jgi:hypothetical protein
VLQNSTKTKVLRAATLLLFISPGISAWRKQTNAKTPGFISSLVIKLAIQMFSLLRNDILNSFLFWAACGTKLTQRL